MQEDEGPNRVVAGQKDMLGIIAEGLREFDKPAPGMALAGTGFSWACMHARACDSVGLDNVAVGLTRRNDNFAHVERPGLLGESIEKGLQNLGGPLGALRYGGLLECHCWCGVGGGCVCECWVNRGRGGALKQA
jgi:hypothetical protein